MADVFISYARADTEFVRKLHQSLKQSNRDIWIDWEDIPATADWLKEIFANIAAADNFLFVISPTSCASEMCLQELAYAEANHKRLVPIIFRPVKPEQLPPALARIQWIPFTNGDFDSAFQLLIHAIDTDLDWVQRHTCLLVRAREWEVRGHDHSLLLRGKDLVEAEQWQGQGGSREPKPHALQSQYILASRQAQSRRQRLALTAVTGAFLLTAILAVFAWVQRGVAKRQAAVAQSRQLAAQSLQLKETRLDLATLLGLEAAKTADTFEGQDALLSSVQTNPHLLKYLHHPGMVICLAFSPDGKTLALGSSDDAIRLWDVAAGKLMAPPLKGHNRAVYALAYSPDGKTLASASFDGTVRLWDITSQKPLGSPIQGKDDSVNSVVFSPDGKTLAFGGSDKAVQLWDVASRQPLGQPLNGHTSNVIGIAFSPNGRLLASASSDKTVRLWDVASRQAIGNPLIGNTDDVNSVAFSHDSTILVSGGNDSILRFWDVRNGGVSGNPVKVSGSIGIRSVVFSPDGKELAVGDVDNTVRIFDFASRRLLTTLLGHTNAVTSVAFRPDGSGLASGSLDQTVILWDLDGKGRAIGTRLNGQAGIVVSSAFSPDGNRLATGGEDKMVRLWDVASRKTAGNALSGHTATVTTLAFSPDGKTLASGSEDKTIRLWDTDSAKPLGDALTGHTDSVVTLSFSRDGKMLASGSPDGTVRLWDPGTRRAVGSPVSIGSAVGAVAFSPDGKTLIVRDKKDVSSLDIATGKAGKINLGIPTFFETESLSQDGRVLASLNLMSNTLWLWDVAARRPLGDPFDSGYSWRRLTHMIVI